MQSLEQWLEHIEVLHSKPIDLGLERMKQMLAKMQLAFDCPVILVGGTNGKGSTCAYLESCLYAAGYKVGLHTSPHLIRFNERARFNKKELTDEQLCEAFAEVEKAREDMTLSYFEYTLLGILTAFKKLKPDVLVLEIGLGGRLDAVNTIEPTASIVTNIGIDHTAYLGDTREKIGWEKAFIYRPNKLAVCADKNPPVTLLDYAKDIKADLKVIDRDFNYVHEEGKQTWDFIGSSKALKNLPLPHMLGEHQLTNASGALEILTGLSDVLPVTQKDIEAGLVAAHQTGRFQVVRTNPEIILDVGHNPHAALVLERTIRERPVKGKTIAVFGMLSDKDRAKVCSIMKDSADQWFLADLPGPRGGSAKDLSEFLEKAGVNKNRITQCATVEAALNKALERAAKTDRIIVYGSFLTVSAAIEALKLEVR